MVRLFFYSFLPLLAAAFSPVVQERMTYPEAKSFCEARNSSLPTVRDFAEWAIARGAKGFLSAREEQEGKIPPGYYLVASQYDDGSSDRFYFSHEGFRGTEASLPADSYWTLSTAAQHPDYAHVFYSAFGGGGGKPEEHRKTFRNAVVCAE